ncbi:MAG: hypothetical protein ACRBC3_04390 [Burkholderiaceae bacterium]
MKRESFSETDQISQAESKPAVDIVVRVVRTEDQLNQARLIRELSYYRTAPNYAPVVARPDPMDYDPHAIIFLAESRSTGLPLASVRVESGRAEQFYPVDHYPIPKRLDRKFCAYVSRLAAQPGRQGRQAKDYLIKTINLYCMAMQYKWLLLIAVPPRDRHYKVFGFSPLPELSELQPLPDTETKKGRIMVCDLMDAERECRESNHPYYEFVYQTHSPEIEIFSSVKGAWLTPRAEGSKPPTVVSNLEELNLPPLV